MMIPPFGNYALALLKDSSLASTISVVELTLVTERAISYNYQPAMMWAAAAVIYLALSMVASFLFSLFGGRRRPHPSAPRAPLDAASGRFRGR